jgi:hypothetical protein
MVVVNMCPGCPLAHELLALRITQRRFSWRFLFLAVRNGQTALAALFGFLLGSASCGSKNMGTFGDKGF